MSPQLDVVASFAQIADGVATAGTVEDARNRVVTAARDALGSAGAAMWHLQSDGKMQLDSFTDAKFMQLMSDIVGKRPDGPAWQAMQDRRVMLANDFAAETRWPRYVSRLLTESPVRSAVCYPLALGGVDFGVLAVYAHESDHFAADLVESGAVFAAHATLLLRTRPWRRRTSTWRWRCSRTGGSGSRSASLMATGKLTEQSAFDLLRTTSQTTHVKLAVVAEEVIFTGTVADLQPNLA